MAFYQVTYKHPEGWTTDDYLLEAKNASEAKEYAKYRVSGSYGETSLVFESLKRISKPEARSMAEWAICWVDSLDF